MRLNDILNEKSVSKAQQRFMGMVHAAQQGEAPASPEVADVAKDMKKSDAADFAKTKHAGLPDHVKEADVVDTVTLDVPLMIRMFEYAREDAQTDMDLHDVAERMIELSKQHGSLSMENYDDIVGDDAELDEDKAERRAQLAKDVEAFLAMGGSIDKVKSRKKKYRQGQEFGSKHIGGGREINRGTNGNASLGKGRNVQNGKPVVNASVEHELEEGIKDKLLVGVLSLAAAYGMSDEANEFVDQLKHNIEMAQNAKPNPGKADPVSDTALVKQPGGLMGRRVESVEELKRLAGL